MSSVRVNHGCFEEMRSVYHWSVINQHVQINISSAVPSKSYVQKATIAFPLFARYLLWHQILWWWFKHPALLDIANMQHMYVVIYDVFHLCPEFHLVFTYLGLSRRLSTFHSMTIPPSPTPQPRNVTCQGPQTLPPHSEKILEPQTPLLETSKSSSLILPWKTSAAPIFSFKLAQSHLFV